MTATAPPATPRPAAPGTPPLGRRLTVAACAFPALVVGGLLLHGGVRPLEMEEPRRAVVALEMLLGGDPLVPTTNGIVYVNKPPLFNWVLAGMVRLTGITSEWLFRLPTVLSFLAMALLLAVAARSHLGRRTALAAAAMVLTFTTLLFYGTLYGEIDVFYALLVTAQALAIFAFEQAGRPLLLFTVSYLFAALGFLTKGFPSVAVQALTLVAWLAATRRIRWLFSLAHLAGLATFALLVGGYLAAYSRRADATQLVLKLLVESSERTAADGGQRLGRILLQLVRFPADLAALCLPWIALAPALLLPAVRRRVRGTPFLWFSTLFIGVNAVPYWLSPGNKPRYMFMFLPFAAALLAAAGQHLPELGRYGRALRWLCAGVLTAAAVGGAALPLTPAARYLPGAWGLAGWVAVTVALAGLAVACWRRPEQRALLVMGLLALAVARLAYDLVIPYVRAEHAEATFYKGVAAELTRDFPGEPISLAGVETARAHRLPLGVGEVPFLEREWFNFSLSFYLTSFRGRPVPFSTALAPGRLYLVHPSFESAVPYDVLRHYDCPRGERERLLLVRPRAAEGG